MAARDPHDPARDDSSCDESNPYASATRWRHQESSAYAAYAAEHMNHHVQPRDPAHQNSGASRDLADSGNKSRFAPAKEASQDNAGRFKPIGVGAAEAQGHRDNHPTLNRAADAASADAKEIVCGPLLNYRNMKGNKWYGSVLCVACGGGKHMSAPTERPVLSIKRIPLRANAANTASLPNGDGPAVNGDDYATDENGWKTTAKAQVSANVLYSDPRNTFYQFNIEVEMDPEVESRWEYIIDGLRFPDGATKPQRNNFFVPSMRESMRILFFSCNGFSVGTDEDAWSGPALWNDVMRQQNSETPFHVMIGGGDQIYNDGVRVDGPLRPWTDISNPKKRRDHPYPEKLRQECDDWYLKNYISWYNTDPFATANGQIPQINIWDDHDIIDGFGSYVNSFMKCDVFRGIGGTAHKYYMLFQHHLAPPPSTYTSDEGAALGGQGPLGQGVDPNQQMDTFVADREEYDCYVVGSQPGPYVSEHSYSIFTRLGARIAFAGMDARTERTRHQVNYQETYDQLFTRLRQEFAAANEAGNPYKHLILLLGIPIAYPRLTWLENLFTSPLMVPIKFLNKRFGVGGDLFNHFDGAVDLLDDLDDHYTARTHKKERNLFIERLQSLAGEFSIRITILGGDVHLAALGRFYSHPHLNVPVDRDHRYMANVISSAIVNKPPPYAIANLLARLNKIHHLNHDTDETLLKLFNKDPGNSRKTASHNHVTMPSRNFAIITENSPHNAPRPVQEQMNGDAGQTNATLASNSGHKCRTEGELGCGTNHIAASELHGKGNDGSLDICIRVEIDQYDPQGRTEGYGLTVPALQYVRGMQTPIDESAEDDARAAG